MSVAAGRIALLLRKACLSLAFLSGIAMLMMMLAGTLDIIGTNVFAKPVPAAFEFMAAMMVVVVFFAVSLAQARRAHIRVEVVFQHFPKSVQFVVDILQYLLNTAFYGLIAYFGWAAGFLSFEQGEFASGIVNFPIWPARFALCVGASLMTLVCIYDLVAHLARWDRLMEPADPGPIS
jgi:TRAP-type mannitol/chloroaromatic compound transport system permease small subunit